MSDENLETLDLAKIFISLNGLAFTILPNLPTNIPTIDTIEGFLCLDIK